jgi:hypothetical protein
MKPPNKDGPAQLHKLPSGKTVVLPGVSAESAGRAEIAFFASYTEYSKTLRAWLVAYGIGGPVLFLTNDGLSAALKLSAYRDWIVDLFLIGVALQVVLAFINKWCAWHMYVGEYASSFQGQTSYKVWSWLNEKSWLDLVFDGGSIIAFSISTILAVRVFS